MKRPRPKSSKRGKKKPLKVSNANGDVIDVDAALLDVAIDEGAVTLPEILSDLQSARTEHAQMLADTLKSTLAHLPDSKRLEAVSNFNLWIETHADGYAATMRDTLGLPHETREIGSDELRESSIALALDAARSENDTRKRDDLIHSAARHLARLNNPLAVERWKKEFSGLGVTAETLKTILKQTYADDDDDPIRALIREAAESADKEQALRNLFNRLANLSAFELIKYRSEVQDRLEMNGAVFESLLTQTRRLRGKSEIVEGQIAYLGEPLCNFAAEITHQLTIDDGQNAPSVRYTISAKLADGKPLPAVEIDAEEFEQVSKWVARHWGADGILFVAPSKSYQVSRAMKEISRLNGLKRETVHTFTGWTNVGGKRVFLTAGGAINADGLDSTIRVELGHNRLAYYRLPIPPTNADELRAAVRHSIDFLSLAPLRVSAPLWCAMYGAPLMEVASLNAVIWIYGPTQSRKSTLTMLALTHFGEQFIRSREYYAPLDWMSTITAMEGAMFATKNVPMVIDDFAPQFTGLGESRDMHKKAHNVVRSVGNRSARGRANADLTERTQRPPRGIVIGTAELPLAGQSIVGRMIYVPVERGDVALSDGQAGPLDNAQAIAGPGSGMYAKAMSGYVHWLAKNWDSVSERARANHERANQYARTVFPSTQSRLMDYYADLITYARTALEFAVEVGAIEKDKALALGNEQIPAALIDLLSNQSVRVAGQSPVVRLFEAVAESVLSRKAYLAPRVGSAPTPPHDAALIGWWGHDRESSRNVIYLRLSTCLQLARDYWQRTGESFDTTTDALQREIFQANLLARRAADQYTVSVWIASENKTVRALAIDRERITEISGIDLWPGGETENRPPEESDIEFQF